MNSPEPEPSPREEDEYFTELVDVPYEVQEEEIVEKEVVKETIEEKQYPQVKASYAYSGQGLTVAKGEVSHILSLLSSHIFRHSSIDCKSPSYQNQKTT